MKAFLAYVLYIKFKVFLERSDNRVGMEFRSTDVEQLGAIQLDQEDVFPFIQITKGGWVPGADLYRYLSFYQVLITTDYTATV